MRKPASRSAQGPSPSAKAPVSRLRGPDCHWSTALFAGSVRVCGPTTVLGCANV